VGLKPLSGRNYIGKICVHHKSGGVNKIYYLIDFHRKLNMYGFIYKIFIDINRTSLVGGIVYENGLFSYIILTDGLKIGSYIYSGLLNKEYILGYTLLLKNIKLFTVLNNIELYCNKGAKLVRSAGNSAIATSFNNNIINVKLKSGWNVKLSIYNLATYGNVSNSKHKFNIINKAGNNRLLGIRPSVRGVAMNPCDHPHGGGEGKKSPPSAQRSPWGWLTKGTPSLKKRYQIRKKKLYKNI